MCQFLKISRSYYYKLAKLRAAINNVDKLEVRQEINKRIEDIYNSSNKMYGCRKISACLAKEKIDLSAYKVLKMMKESGLSSLYNKRKKYRIYKQTKVKFNEQISNVLEQKFEQSTERKVISSDLTYVPFENKFLYICFVIDLFNREIISHGVSDKHDAQFVYNTLTNINLDKVQVFHSDRGSEFLNYKIHKLLNDHNVVQSASKPGCPYDNAVSENLFGIFKREWMKKSYKSIEELNDDVNDFVLNYNNFRLHSKLNYKSPIEYRISMKEQVKM